MSERRYTLAELEDALPPESEARAGAAGPFVLPDRIAAHDPGRNHTLWRYGRALKVKGWKLGRLLAELERVNAERCDPPLAADELAEITYNVFAEADRPAFSARRNGHHADDRPGAERPRSRAEARVKAAQGQSAGPTTRPSATGDADWPDLVGIRVEPSPCRIPPGEYQARSVHLESFVAYQRRCLAIYFDVYRGGFEQGEIIARLPMFFRLPPSGGRLAPSAKLARMFDLIQPRTRRRDRLSMNPLKNRLWLVEVGDCLTSAPHERQRQPRPLHARQVYSVVRAVREHLA